MGIGSAFCLNENMKKNGYYTILHLNPDAAPEEIEAAFQREKRWYEMEGRAFRGPRAKELAEAYGVLSDADKRKCYDAEQDRSVMTMEELEQKVREDYPETRLERLINDAVENPWKELLIFLLALLAFIISRK